MKKSRFVPFVPSSLFLYYNTRMQMHVTHKDLGSDVVKAFEAINLYGICPETMWSFSNKFDDPPPPECYEFGQRYRLSLTWNHYPQPTWDTLYTILLSGKVILCSLQIFRPRIIRNGFLVLDPEAILEKNYFHSILIVGIYPEYLVLLDSYGTKQGINGILKIRKEDVGSFLLEAFEIQVDLQFPHFCPSSLINNSTGWNPVVHYDHIIIGGGVSGAYLAFLLPPGESVLVVDEPGKNQLYHSLPEPEWVPAYMYRYSEQHSPLLHDWLVSMGMAPKKRLEKVDETSRYYLSFPVVQKLVNGIYQKFGKPCWYDLKRLILSKVKENVTVYSFLKDHFDFSAEEWNQLQHLMKNEVIIQWPLLPANFLIEFLFGLFTDYVVCDLSQLVEKTFRTLGFQTKSFANLSSNPGYGKLDAHAKVVSENKVFLTNPGVQGGMIVSCNHIYQCHMSSQVPGAPSSIPIFYEKMYFFFDVDVSAFYDPSEINCVWGRTILWQPNTIMVNVINQEFYTQVVSCLEGSCYKNGLLYSIQSFPSFDLLLSHYPLLKEIRPKRFVTFFFENRLGFIPPHLYADYASLVDLVLRPRSNIHYIHSHYSSSIGNVESTLEMVHDLMVSLKF